MDNNERICTATMARLYADQGYLREAEGIYRRLLERNPESTDIREALASVEMRIEEKAALESRGLRPNDLDLLFRKWIDLLFLSRKIEKLKHIG
jgi:hypothetical protein